jgi:hypothetical protein
MTIPAGSEGVVAALLEEATEHLRSLLGWVAPTTTSTVTLWAGPGPQWLEIPLQPLISVDAVTVQDIPSWPTPAPAAVPVSVVQFDNRIRVCGPGKVTVTATHGFSEVPGDLRSWCCVLAAEAFKNMQDLGMVGSGMVASVALDDFRQSYHPAGNNSGPFSLPPNVVERLQAQYGRGTYVTGSMP